MQTDMPSIQALESSFNFGHIRSKDKDFSKNYVSVSSAIFKIGIQKSALQMAVMSVKYRVSDAKNSI